MPPFPGHVSHSSPQETGSIPSSNRTWWSAALPGLYLAVKNPGNFHLCSLGIQLPGKGAEARLLNQKRSHGERGPLREQRSTDMGPRHQLNAAKCRPQLTPHGSENPPSGALPESPTPRIMKSNTLLWLLNSFLAGEVS